MITDEVVKKMMKEDRVPYGPIRGGRYLVIVDDSLLKEKHKGSIYIPDKETNKDVAVARRATVLKSGDKPNHYYGDGHAWAKQGDRVLLQVHAGDTVFNSDGKGTRYRIIDDSNILMNIEEEN